MSLLIVSKYRFAANKTIHFAQFVIVKRSRKVKENERGMVGVVVQVTCFYFAKLI